MPGRGFIVVSLCCGILCAGRAQDVALRWPEAVVPPEAEVGEGEPVAGWATAYRTRSFEVRAARPLDPAKLRAFAGVVDAVPVVLRALPLPLFQPPAQARPIIEVVADEPSFLAAGGVENMAGAYLNRRQCIVVRGDILFGPAAAARDLAGRRRDLNLIVHEAVHLGMHRLIGRLPPWFSEGCAEYVTAARCADGRFVFTAIEPAVRGHLALYLGAEAGRFTVAPVAAVMALDGDGWSAHVAGLPEAARYRPYATSLLLAHYFFHGGDERRGALRGYLDEVLRPAGPRHPAAAAPVLPAPPPAELQAKLSAFWGIQGVRLVFAE